MYVYIQALGRESKDLDRVALQYSTTLQSLNPRMLDNLYSVYKDKLGDRNKKKASHHNNNNNNNNNQQYNNNNNQNIQQHNSSSSSSSSSSSGGGGGVYKDTKEVVVAVPEEEVKGKVVISKYSKDATKRLQPSEVRATRSDASLLDDDDNDDTYTGKNNYRSHYVVRLDMCMYVCMHVCIYICMYVCMYAYL